MKIFPLIINGKKIKAREGQTILEIAQENGIEIPTLCKHSDLKAKASCRVCVVQVQIKDGKKRVCLKTACSTKVEEGMEIITSSPEIEKARKVNLELLFAQHQEECYDCVWNFKCRLLELAKKYGLKITRFKDRKTNLPTYQFGPSLIYDSSKCIDCRNCVEVCKKQEIGYLELKPLCYLSASYLSPPCPAKKEKDTFLKVLPSQNKECIYCGQCITHCPVGAFEAVGEFEEIEEPFQDKNKMVVFQLAPSIRISIGEEFGMAPDETITERLVAGIKKLGANKVFDLAVGADFTASEEAGEFLEKLEAGKKFTLFSSYCPAWVRFVEVYYPEFISHLATTRPPHIILGGLIKTFWAKQQKIAPEKLIVVSVVPCVAKKYEITKKEILTNFENKTIKPVDYVLTARELAYLFRKYKIDLKKIKPKKIDDPFAIPSGAGVLYEINGGAIESILRSALSGLSGKKLGKIDFQQTGSQKRIKTTVIETKGRKLKLAVVNGTGNAKKILEELKQNPDAYNYLEVMACPDGCCGGGGQPVPTDGELRQKIMEWLYKIKEKQKIRISHKNPIVKKIYKEFLTNKEIIEKLCRVQYSKNP